MADEPAAPPAADRDPGLESRVGALESGQQSIIGKLDQLLGAGNVSRETTEPPAVDVAEEIRRQLEKRDRKAAAAAAAPAAPAAPDPKELAEKTPAPMARRVEKIMGWAELCRG
jgi:hypothetical protein